MTKALPDPEDLLSELAFRCPEIGPAISRVSIKWDDSVPTACVHIDGRILINPELADIAVQVVAHEVMHLVGEHFVDMPAPQWDPLLSNIAGDIWLNGILQDMMPQLEWPKNWLYPADAAQRDMTAREIYERIKSSAKTAKVGLGSGCGIVGPKDQGSGQGQGMPGLDKAAGGTGSQNPVDQAAASAVMAGIGSVLPRVNNAITPPPPKTSIPEVLREAAKASAGHTKPRSTFARLGRRSTPMVPRRGRVKRGPAVVVVVDVSGSMYSDLENIRRECVGLAKRAKVHLILHDCKVLFSGQVGVDEMVKRINVAGGTAFDDAYAEAGRVLRKWNLQAAVVHFTDGEVGHWPQPPAPVPAYAGVTTKAMAPAPWKTRHIDGGR